MNKKTCNTCGDDKPLSEFYNEKKNRKDGKQKNCKVCSKAITYAHVHLYPNQTKRVRKAYYIKHRDKLLARSKQWRQDNPEKAKILNAEFKLNNPTYHKEWRLKQKGKFNAE